MKKLILLFCLLQAGIITAGKSGEIRDDIKKFNQTRIASGVKAVLSGVLAYYSFSHSLEGLDGFCKAVYPFSFSRAAAKKAANNGVLAGGMGYVGFLLARYSIRKTTHALDL